MLERKFYHSKDKMKLVYVKDFPNEESSLYNDILYGY